MLERLDEIAWADLTHGRGEAAGVPQWLRGALAGDDESVNALYATLWDEGRSHAATPAAVPFLLDIVRGQTCPKRAEVMALLGLIARSEGEWAARSKEAVAAAVPLAVELLGDPGSGRSLRRAAVHLLAIFLEQASLGVPALQAALAREDDAYERATIGVALFLLGAPAEGAFDAHDEDAAELQTALTSSTRDELLSLILDWVEYPKHAAAMAAPANGRVLRDMLIVLAVASAVVYFFW